VPVADPVDMYTMVKVQEAVNDDIVSMLLCMNFVCVCCVCLCVCLLKTCSRSCGHVYHGEGAGGSE
jgi:hypothetical protein